MTVSRLPRWDLSNVYPSLASAEFETAIAELQSRIETLEQRLAQHTATVPDDPVVVAELLGKGLDHFNALYELGETLQSYLYCFVDTDSRDQVAAKRLSAFDQLWARLQTLRVQAQAWVGRLGPMLEQALPLNATAQAHAFPLREIAEQAQYLMSEAEESLAAELELSGGNAWRKLQRTVTSQVTVDFELDSETQTLPMTALINLRSHPDEDVRRRAYEAETAAWVKVREPLAAALNSIKGAANTLNKRRGRTDSLHVAIDMSRLDRPTLETMLAAMADSFPMFRRYFHAKAALLGKERLAWWDLFAPVGKAAKSFTWEECRAFVLENFGNFSPDLAAFAQRAFDQCWIDAEPRDGKVGGAYCTGLPAVRESRILANFDGSLNEVSTIAHELGHAYHNECRYRAGKTVLQSDTPMTLAETASLMCETIVMEAALARAQDEQEELGILENILNGASQVIVDIYSRYLFEQEVFVRRVQAELSADELCEIMSRAQLATYGDGLDERYLQPYMWTWKPHYYYLDFPFYNFPYAFGLLFSTGLYAIFQQRGAAFVPDYQELLASTGEAKAADLAARFGLDIRARQFWDDSLALIGQKVERFCALAEAQG